MCIFAPHPDDEILGCGGLPQALVAQGNKILIVSVTQGEKSHPNSALYPTDKLAKIRALESQLALETLDSSLDLPNVSMTNLNFPDGEVFGRQADFLTS
ncbi:MAG: PIG-L family deacetylase [Moraxella osloensis]